LRFPFKFGNFTSIPICFAAGNWKKEGGGAMRKICKKWMTALIISIILFTIGAAITSAQPFSTFVGKVVAVERGVISVEGEKEGIIQFAVGRDTIYIPARQPGVGERVKILYSFKRGEKAAYQVEIVATPPPPPRPEEYFMVTGKVVGMHNYQLTVKDDKKQTIYFSTGKSTVFIPAREPHVDEKVKVTYYVRKGDNVATQVEILSAKK
jgi:hypothetical protein